VIGLGLAWCLKPVVNHYIPASISFKTVAFALFIAAATGIVSGYIPARRAARMDPVDALRDE